MSKICKFADVVSVLIDRVVTPGGSEAVLDCAEHVTGMVLSGGVHASHADAGVKEAADTLRAQYPLLALIKVEDYDEQVGRKAMPREPFKAAVAQWVEEQRIATKSPEFIEVKSMREILGNDEFVEHILKKSGRIMRPQL